MAVCLKVHLLSDSCSLKILLPGQHWEAFVPDAGALSTITACYWCTRSNKRHRCATAARLEVHLGATFQPAKRREAISEVLTSMRSHPASVPLTSVNATTRRTRQDGTHWQMSHDGAFLFTCWHLWMTMCREFQHLIEPGRNAGTITMKSLLLPYRNRKTGMFANTHTHTLTLFTSITTSHSRFLHFYLAQRN